MIEELSLAECELVDGAKLSALTALTYIGIGAIAIGTGGLAAGIVGGMLITATLAVAN